MTFRETRIPAPLLSPRTSPERRAALPWAPRVPGVSMRPATEDDLAALDGFVAGLSTDTAYLRFFVGVGRLPRAMLTLLTTGPGRSCWLATDAEGTTIGHASAALLPGAGSSVADVAMVVTDTWQGMGIGPALAGRAIAALPGVRTLHLTTLTVNQRVRRMVRRYWPDAQPQLADGLWTYRVPAYAS